MKDYLLKAVACEEHVRIYICSSTHLVEEASTALRSMADSFCRIRQNFERWVHDGQYVKK